MIPVQALREEIKANPAFAGYIKYGCPNTRMHMSHRRSISPPLQNGNKNSELAVLAFLSLLRPISIMDPRCFDS
jgi:hypothetical protein